MKKVFQLLMILSVVVIGLATGCKSKDEPTPETAAPTIVVTAPVDNQEYTTSASMTLSAKLTSGAQLSTLTATVTWVSELPVLVMSNQLKSLGVKWAPDPKVVTLNNTSAQTLVDENLFVVAANALPANYMLKLEVKDSAGKTVVEEIPFVIIN